MRKSVFFLLVTLLTCGTLLAPAPSQSKIGVIIHDHGAPGKYDSGGDPYLPHDDNSYYGIKQFLRHLVMMNVIPSIVICGPPSTLCDHGTFYDPVDYYKGPMNADYECKENGGGSGGLNCYTDADCTAPDTCEVSLNIIDSTSTATDQGAGDAFLTDATQDFSAYKDGNYVIIAKEGEGGSEHWWGFIGTEPVGVNNTVYIYNDPGRTTRGWCGGVTPDSLAEKYWLREDPTPLMDVWGDPPADYASLYFRSKDSHYGERYILYHDGPGYLDPPSAVDKNFDEWGGLDFYYEWNGEMGGYEPYFFQNYPQLNNVRDYIWTNYETALTDGMGGTKEDYIRTTQGIDYQFSEDPTKGVCVENGGGSGGVACLSDGDCLTPDTCDLTVMPRHGQSLYNGVIDLIDNVGVDKIIISEHFVGHSRMMNEGMGRFSAREALEASTDPTTPIIYAPDIIQVGEVDYARVDRDFLSPSGGMSVGGHYTFSEKYTAPAYVAGTFFNTTLSDCLASNVVSEINDLINNGAGDIMVMISGHGTPNTLSGAYDSLYDTPHFNTKVWFINGVRNIVSGLGGTPADVTFGPDTVNDAEVNYAGWYKDLQPDGSSGMDVIGRNIKYATVTVSGRKFKFYRVYGQNGYTEQGTSAGDNCEREDPNGPDHPCGPDPHDLVYSSREALQEVCQANVDCNGKVDLNDLVIMKGEFLNVCPPDPSCTADVTDDGKVNLSDLVIMKQEFLRADCAQLCPTDALDALLGFFGDSSDLLGAHRSESYAENFGYCDASSEGADPARCADQKLLYDLADHFPNPGMHETTDIHHVSHYPGTTCVEGTGTPSYDPADWVAGRGVYDETHQFGTDCYRSNFYYKGLDVHITNATYCFDKKEQAVEENIAAMLDSIATDGDYVAAADDNCPSDYNPNQEDGDCDGVGDACDLSTTCSAGVDCDDDCDGVANQNDNCQYVWNPSQADNDTDGIGNACDDNTDSDGDGYGDPWAHENSCNYMWMGMMGMTMPMGMDLCDNCPDVYNPTQLDTDMDGLGDACDQ